MQPQENLSAEEITRLKQYVQKYFLEQQLNCGLTMIHCLSDFFQLPVHEQVYASVNGIMEHRDKRHQCGLYKGALMFLGIYGTQLGWDRAMLNEKTLSLAQAFEEYFHAINCYELRAESFASNPDHNLCCNLAAEAVMLVAGIIKKM